MYSLRARANSSGSSSATHAIFGPAACAVRAEPHRSSTSVAPSRASSCVICATARASTPYRMAGHSGTSSPSVRSTHGPIPLSPTATTSASRGAVSSGARQTNSPHQTAGSISTLPGPGRSTACSQIAEGSTVPSSTPARPCRSTCRCRRSRRRATACGPRWQKSIPSSRPRTAGSRSGRATASSAAAGLACRRPRRSRPPTSTRNAGWRGRRRRPPPPRRTRTGRAVGALRGRPVQRSGCPRGPGGGRSRGCPRCRG